jgi:hypothetical protein
MRYGILCYIKNVIQFTSFPCTSFCALLRAAIMLLFTSNFTRYFQTVLMAVAAYKNVPGGLLLAKWSWWSENQFPYTICTHKPVLVLNWWLTRFLYFIFYCLNYNRHSSFSCKVHKLNNFLPYFSLLKHFQVLFTFISFLICFVHLQICASETLMFLAAFQLFNF